MIRSSDDLARDANMLGIPVSHVAIPESSVTSHLSLTYQVRDESGAVVMEGEISGMKLGRTLVIFNRQFKSLLSTG